MGQTLPPPFWQCQDFHCSYYRNPSLIVIYHAINFLKMSSPLQYLAKRKSDRLTASNFKVYGARRQQRRATLLPCNLIFVISERFTLHCWTAGCRNKAGDQQMQDQDVGVVYVAFSCLLLNLYLHVKVVFESLQRQYFCTGFTAVYTEHG